MTAASRTLTVFEGPDGAGKSTAARDYAAAIGARYVHLGPLPRVNRGLARIYVEAMMPAVLGHEHVVMDRAWPSERPYGLAFRAGADRLTQADRRMLERLALRCAAVLVLCLPPLETCLDNYRRRRGEEMLTHEDQLKAVYQAYAEDQTALPELLYDYTRPGVGHLHERIFRQRTVRCHPLGAQTAGRWGALTVLVGEAFAEVKDQDPLYQWPFASFDHGGCSQWLADQLTAVGIGEEELLWANADMDLGQLDWAGKRVIALGEAAMVKLTAGGVQCHVAPHPQFWRRFRAREPYPLLNLLKG